MDFIGSEFNFDKSSDAVERFIRFLISNNELSLARNILEALGKKYSHLLFELEVKAGNYTRAVEIFNFMPREKQELYIHVVETIEKDASTVSEALEKILKEFNEENYPIVIAEVQRIKKEFPQIVEIIAMELLTALKRSDKKKIELLSEILRQLDKTHPVLTQVKKQKSMSGFLLPAVTLAIFVVVLVNLVISVTNFTKSGSLEFDKLERSIASLQGKVEGYTTDMSKKYEELSKTLELVKTSLDYIDKKLENPVQTSNDVLAKPLSDQLSLINEKLSIVENELSKLAKDVNTRANPTTTSGVQTTVVKYDDATLKELSSQVKQLKEKIVSLESRLESVKTSSSVAAGSSSDDFEKIYSELDNVKARLNRIENNVVEIAKANISENMKNIATKLNEISSQISQLSQSSSNSAKSSQIDSKLSLELEEIRKRLDILTQSVGIMYAEVSSLKSQPVESTIIQQEVGSTSAERILALEQKLEEVLTLIRGLSNKADSQRISLGNIEDKVSNLSKETTTVKGYTESVSKQVADLRNDIETLKSSVSKILEMLNSLNLNTQKIPDDSSSVDKKTEDLSKVEKSKNSSNSLEQSSSSAFIPTYTSTNSAIQTQQVVEQKVVSTNQRSEVVEQILNQTKDLRELFLVGLKFYVDGQYENAVAIFSYIEPRIEDIDVYFKEDVYYYGILSYLGLGKRDEAVKKYEVYKKLYPAGQYVRELSTYFK
ncbi:hypothetical protein SAMN04488510_12119 [Fervidobacterium changbaicum]|uniref:Uncharacterized protein n=2 Tax=Fervidobacterium TaxID=2422 RepID=A0AAI8CLU3_FERIS|nr:MULTISPECIES: hypothetical protein [Fervidobacterium]AMW32928.1 hypothetical protein NA23_06405 [Fervidobacterium islandicum]QAV32967.1 hypothetical protein CBS1_03930 [Fervidobacterium changbaicum]SDH60600.1 hypothetical protein SAMN04488510_12119 [Fervidobacterium changbaicum]